MTPLIKWTAYIGAALLGLVIYYVLTTQTQLQPPIPLAVAMLFVVIDIVTLRWLFGRQRQG